MCDALKNRIKLFKEAVKNALNLLNIFKKQTTMGVGNGGGPKVTPSSPQDNPVKPMPDREGSWNRGHRTDKPYNPQQKYYEPN